MSALPRIRLFEPRGDSVATSTNDADATTTTISNNARPTPPLSPRPISPPRLILLFSWADAGVRPIQRYIKGCQDKFPHSRLLLVQNGMIDHITKGPFEKRRLMRPALDIVLATVAERPSDPGILLYIMSNGGAMMATHLAEIYEEKTGKPLPARATVFDSCPGRARFQQGVKAMKAAMLPKNFILRPLALILIYVAAFTYMIINRTFSRTHPFDVMRSQLLDPKYFLPGTRRCYIYSKGDEMVAWQDVEEHALQAANPDDAVAKRKNAAWTVDLVLFQGSAHCAHLVKDSQKYWDAVGEAWGSKPARPRISTNNV